MRRLFIELLLIFLAFAGGYVLMNIKAQRQIVAAEETRQQLQARVDEALRQRHLFSLLGHMGMLLREVEDQNFGKARALSSQFFDNLQEATTASEGTLGSRLKGLLSRRDEVTADLSTMNPETLAKLRQFYRELHSAVEDAAGGSHSPQAVVP